MKKPALDKNNIPKHVGIIMDGNRRWAVKKNRSSIEGHEAGLKALVEIVEYCLKLKIETLTVYALSTENWKRRAKEEVKGIFGLLVKVAKEKKEEYGKKGVKIAILGDFQAFPRKVSRAVSEITSIVKKNTRLKLNIALNYGGRDEIIRAIKKISKEGVPERDINEKLLGKYLYTSGEKDPDLIIRTGGEKRLSNFLLWQTSYSELYFTDTLWPDFSPKKLEEAIIEYQQRQRRFGK